MCPPCQKRLTPVLSPFCKRCAEPFPGEITEDFQCPNCEGIKTQHYSFAVCPWDFSGTVRELIHGFKFERKYELHRLIGWLATAGLKDPRIACRNDWVVVPVPLHPARMREREFNQSEEIAIHVAKATGFRLRDELRRRKDTGHQAQLTRQERLRNLKGAFSLSDLAKKNRIFHERHVLLIDDVLTTGATIDECAKVLKKEGGAYLVAALTVARG